MAYYTVVYEKFPDNWKENLIFRNDLGFEVWESGSSWYLIKDGYKIGILIDSDRFQNAYNGDFEKWINVVRKKDIDKIENLQEYQEQISKDIEVIESIWK